MTILKNHLALLAIAVLAPIVLLPVQVLVTVAGVALAVAILVAVADWAAHDAFAVRRTPATGPVPDALERGHLVDQ